MEIIIIHGRIITDSRIFMTDLINEPTKRADFETPTCKYITLQQLWQILPTQSKCQKILHSRSVDKLSLAEFAPTSSGIFRCQKIICRACVLGCFAKSLAIVIEQKGNVIRRTFNPSTSRNLFACRSYRVPETFPWQYERHGKHSMINRKSFSNIESLVLAPDCEESFYVILQRNGIYHFQKFISNQPSPRSVSRFFAFHVLRFAIHVREISMLRSSQFARGRVRWRLKLVAPLRRNVIQYKLETSLTCTGNQHRFMPRGKIELSTNFRGIVYTPHHSRAAKIAFPLKNQRASFTYSFPRSLFS